MGAVKKIESKELDTVIDNALNSSIFDIQTHLGVDSGDAAGIFFSGERWDKLRDTMKEYVQFERIHGDAEFRVI